MLQNFNRYIYRPLRRSRYRRKDNIRIYLKEIGITMRNWVYSALVREPLVNAALNLRVP